MLETCLIAAGPARSDCSRSNTEENEEEASSEVGGERAGGGEGGGGSDAVREPRRVRPCGGANTRTGDSRRAASTRHDCRSGIVQSL